MQPDEASVLIIEDDANNLLILTSLLRLIGVKHIHGHASGRQGLEFAERLDQVDLILLDIQLPDEDGYIVLERIRANPKLHAVRVVAVTANVLPHDEARARAAGFDGFIGKPLSFERFPQQIRTLLNGESVWISR